MVSVSVIIMCYRQGLLLRDALASVLSQTIQPLEALLVNDGSPDEITNSIFRDVGAFGYGSVMALLTDVKPWKALGSPWSHASREFTRRRPLPHVGLLARRSLFSEVVRFDESFKVVPDYDWTVRALAATTRLFASFPVAAFGANGLSSNPRNQMPPLSECRRVCKQHVAYQLTLAEMGRWVHGLAARLFFADAPRALATPAQAVCRKLSRNAVERRRGLPGRNRGGEGRHSCG